MQKRAFTLLMLLLALTAGAQSLADELRREIGSDNIGVAVITSWGDTVVVNGERHYPLMSVFKFHQAVASSATPAYFPQRSKYRPTTSERTRGAQ